MFSPLFAMSFPEIASPIVLLGIMFIILWLLPNKGSEAGKVDSGVASTGGFVIVGIFIGIVLAFNPAWHDSFKEWGFIKWVWNDKSAAGTASAASTKQTLTLPKNPTYNPKTGEVTVEDAPPAGSVMVVYWKGGLTIQDKNGGSRFPGKSGNIGTGASEVFVRFYNEGSGEMSQPVAVK